MRLAIGDGDGLGDGDVARTCRTGRDLLVTLVDALQVAPVRSHRTHALVIVGQSLGDRQFAAAAFAFRFLGCGRLGRAGLAGTALLAAALILFLILQPAARGRFRRGRLAGLGGFLAAGGFLLGALLGGIVGSLAGVFFGLALFGGDALGLELLFLARFAFGFLFRHAAGFTVGDPGVRQGGGAAGLFLIRKLAQHHAARLLGRLGGCRRGGGSGGLFG
jgi:hypothetical protein